MLRRVATNWGASNMHRAWVTTLRIFRYGLSNFSRNAWLSTAATAVMVLTLSIILITFSSRMVFDDTIAKIREKIDVSIYLKDGITDDQREQFIAALKNLPIVSSVDYVSKDAARKAFTDQNKSYAEQLQALSELGDVNPFPASLRVHTNNTIDIEPISQLAARAPYKDWQAEAAQVSDERRQAINTIERTASFAELMGLIASVIFVTLSIMIIFNTIRMAIFNRRDEIEIMKLIGANKRFIRGPFIVEASLYGIFAAILAVALMYALLVSIQPGLSSYDISIGPTAQFFAQWPVPIFAAVLLIGVIIGMLSSSMAIRRYLKL